MPLPFALNHINLWLLEDGEGWTIVDCGLASEETKAYWQRLFETKLGGRPVGRVICTHFHPDHAGLAGWLVERWGVELWMSRTEFLFARSLQMDAGQPVIDHMLAFYKRAGCGPEFLEAISQIGATYPKRVTPLPRAYHRMHEGEEIDIGGRLWKVVVGTGHAPEHCCLHCPELGVLIAGDMVLPRISPNVSVWNSEPEANPLADFLASLAKLSSLPAETTVLPSHNEPFLGMRERLAELAQHHEERLVDLLGLLDRQKTAIELAKDLFKRKLDLHQTTFAVGETLAHLHLLRARDQAKRVTDANGVHLYERA
ncbi:MAG: MBL fold metallo-hydrolase [Proteobacteria bacterium]|nr:MBL fold metallo-hydrolase [Pseudomonadota bacterium]